MARLDDGAEGVEGGVKSGPTLLGDLDEIQEKVQRSKQKQNAAEVDAAHQASAAVISCYQYASLLFPSLYPSHYLKEQPNVPSRLLETSQQLQAVYSTFGAGAFFAHHLSPSF